LSVEFTFWDTLTTHLAGGVKELVEVPLSRPIDDVNVNLSFLLANVEEELVDLLHETSVSDFFSSSARGKSLPLLNGVASEGGASGFEMAKVDLFELGISILFLEVVVGQECSAVILVSKLSDSDVIKEFGSACIVDHRFVFLVRVKESLHFGVVYGSSSVGWCGWCFHELVLTG